MVTWQQIAPKGCDNRGRHASERCPRARQLDAVRAGGRRIAPAATDKATRWDNRRSDRAGNVRCATKASFFGLPLAYNRM